MEPFDPQIFSEKDFLCAATGDPEVQTESAQAQTSPTIHAESVSQDAGLSQCEFEKMVEFALDGKDSSFRERSDH
jgi:hypothetical protein